MKLIDLYPKIMSKIEDKDLDEFRYLVVVDKNEFDPEIDDEFDVFDPADYNFIAYITERFQEAMGKEFLENLPNLLEESKIFEDFLQSEIDLYGIKSNLEDEDDVAKALIDLIEEHLA